VNGIEFAGTSTGKAQATLWLNKNRVNLTPLSEATNLRPTEVATGQAAEQQLGHSLYESPNAGADFVDSLGNTYDALLEPAVANNWNWAQIEAQINRHLMKANYTIIDSRGLTPAQLAQLRNHINGLSAAQQAQIITIGF
jgi:hypothetical protein